MVLRFFEARCRTSLPTFSLSGYSIMEDIKPLGDMYMEEVTADDIRLALIPLSNKSESLHNTVNMLLKCIFYSAERSSCWNTIRVRGFRQKEGNRPKRKIR